MDGADTLRMDTPASSYGDVLVAGGAGFIGTHTVLCLLESGWGVVVVDNLVNSSEVALDRVKHLVGSKTASRLLFYNVDLQDKPALEAVFEKHRQALRVDCFSAVIHFAGLKAVGESVSKPLLYYRNNIVGTLNLIECMDKYNCKRMVFSSSATVYGAPREVPAHEELPLSATNPYGQTKLMIESILRDVYVANNEWRIVLLRYFNPVGAHPSGQIGEDPQGIPNNLMPILLRVATGRMKEVMVYGNDYDTSDGTGVRDYIHVMDLATGHVAALDKLERTPSMGCVAYNLGTGVGTSVLKLLKEVENASGKKIPYRIVGRRPGDIATVFANPGKAERELGWKATHGIPDMCKDAWNWAVNNPYGYGAAENA
eukprot:jgi/Chlat1/4871/Chrsp31S04813